MNSQLQSRRGSYGGEEPRNESKNRTGGAIAPDFLVLETEEDQAEGAREAEEEEVDEGEMRRIVMGRFGGWVDWAVGWMDFRDEGDGDEGPLEDGEENLLQKTVEKQVKEQEWDEIGAEMGKESDTGAGPPPPLPAGDGIWTDTKWLLGVASKIVL